MCTAATGNCDGYLACYGAKRGYPGGYVTGCKVGIEEPYCDPGPCEPWE